MISAETSLLLSLAIPLAGFVLISRLDSRPHLRDAASALTAALLLVPTAIVFVAVDAGQRPELALFEISGELRIAFRAEPLGAMFAALASLLWLVNSIYSIGYMREVEDRHQTRFAMAFCVAIAAAMGVAYAANLPTLFIFYEVLTLATWPLVAHKGDDAAQRGGRTYLATLLATSLALLLPAIVLTYAVAGSAEFVPGGLLAQHAQEAAPWAGLLLGLFVFGVGKAALMPFHFWLPAAMVAPTPVSAFLHAVAVVKAGVFAILKIAVYIFGPGFLEETGVAEPYLWVAAATILLASIVALRADDLKARLAYSTVSQLAYVTLGALLATTMGVLGGGLQIAAHAFGKMTLFMCAGAIYVAAHKTKVSEMRGLGRTMPLTFTAFFVGALSVAGLPPLPGSWAKFLLLLGSAEKGELALLGVLTISTVLTMAYLLSVPLAAFFLAPVAHGERAQGSGPAPLDWRAVREAPLLCLAPPMLTALLAFVLFFVADALADYLQPIMESGS